MNEVALGEVVTRVSDRVKLDADTEYPTVGVYSFGRGLFARPTIKGSETRYDHYFRISASQFLYSKLFAWEGAVAVVPPALDGRFVSQEFPTFDVDTSRVDVSYLAAICRWPEFWARIRMGESGMGGRRKRVHPDKLLLVKIPLPSLDEQRRIADVFACLSRTQAAYAELAAATAGTAKSLRARHFSALDGSSVRAGDMFEVTIGRQRAPKHASGRHVVPYLRAANVKDGRLNLDDVKSMNFDPLEQLKFALQDGDVLVTEGCGSLSQLGASAQWREDLRGTVCFQNTLVRLRGKAGWSTSDYAYQWARNAFETGVFSDVASGTNIFHIGATRLSDLRVTQVPLEEQEVFVSEVAAVDVAATAAADAAARTGELFDQIREDLLRGRRELGESLDRVGQVVALA